MLNPIVIKFRYGKHIVTLETGAIARQATSSVIADMDGTTVLVTVVANEKPKSNQYFFPLVVNYQERAYAAGKIPGSFFRREGRPSENEILITRLIDRSIRPLFPEGFVNEVQIIATVISINQYISPDIVAIIGTSAALSISGIPFNGPIGVARIGYINDQFALNPTLEELKSSKLDLVVTGINKSVLMLEAQANLLTEEQILDAIVFGYNKFQIIIQNIDNLVKKVNNLSWNWQPQIVDKELNSNIIELAEPSLNNAYYIIDKQERHIQIHAIKSEIIATLIAKNIDLDENKINDILYLLERKIVRNRILSGKLRIDGRKKDEIRELDARVGMLSRTHGSALFTRGETQTLVTTTLGRIRDGQVVDELTGEYTENFIFHYNFPSYSVGEIGIIGLPKRREIGHGALAKRSLLAVMPNINKFPYTIRVVSEITESNGSSSMASVCGASLALMDAGVPIKSSIAGVAMGLVQLGSNYVILTDISSDEDYFGDMDFKIAGSYNGISALQMDVKIQDINIKIIKEILNQAKQARISILKVMEQVISYPRKDISKFAQRIHTMRISPNKIKDLIGRGGYIIRSLIEETGATIEIDDDGIVRVSAMEYEKIKHAVQRIKEITTEIKIGCIYNGKVIRIVDFGVFVSIDGINKEGLVHISEISNKRVEKITDYLHIGQHISVKVLEINYKGRISLSLKEATINNRN